jgi:hypothetical protein
MYTDIHEALSWDRLHFIGGLYRDHLWAELQKIVVSLGRAKVAQMDKKYVCDLSTIKYISQTNLLN